MFLAGSAIGIAQQHTATGLVLAVDPAHHAMTVSCDAIPGYMGAMEMSFSVSSSTPLASLTPGSAIRFTMAMQKHLLLVDNIQAISSADFLSESMEAGGLAALNNALAPTAPSRIARLQHRVPDFALTDQAGRQVRLSQLRGKVVLLTFGYSRCPNPDYCARLAGNLSNVENRFSRMAGRDLILLTVAIDPEHDRGEALRQYAETWHADPAHWHFLTGNLTAIQQVSAIFGMNFWRNGGLLTHSLHTVLIDRNGRLVANLEGNQFTARQLGDLVSTVMSKTH